MSSGAAEATDDSEDTSLPAVPKKYVLEQFRQQWKQELNADQYKRRQSADNSADDSSDSDNGHATSRWSQDEEDEAKSLFAQAAEMEKIGKVFEAMRLYRRAIQIVPDIEFKMYDATKVQEQGNNNSTDRNATADDVANSNAAKLLQPDDDENLDGVDLMERFEIDIQKAGRFFQRAINDTGIISTGSHFHISDLPVEIIFYILKWVVSSDLDLRSLDTCSAVSKGFYICAKDPDIWRLACVKIWGANIGTPKLFAYDSWRQMFLDRHRIHFNGCYISKTNYFRYGENSFQDQFYRPVQLIEYYRYIRFFTDGHALMMTSTDEPAQGVTKLKFNHSAKNEILKGHYRLQGDMIRIALQRNRTAQQYNRTNHQQRRGSIIDDVESHTFFLELKIVSSSKRKFNQLQWKHYSIIQSNNHDEISTEFEITQAKYPSLYFSRVKSYNLVSENPLQ